VRPAAAADVPALVALATGEGQQAAAMRRRFAADLAGAHRELLVAPVPDGGGPHGRALVGYGRIARFDPPPGAPAIVAPAGWYLGGLLVAGAHRRRGIGAALTRARLDWIFARSDEAWFFANARNLASLALHERLGFIEVTRDFVYPGVGFEGGVGVLCRAARGRPAAGGSEWPQPRPGQNH
jgi:ribosomal protein S18 acetylase RimI-like enzyme